MKCGHLLAVLLILTIAKRSFAQTIPEHRFTLKESPAVVEGMCYDPEKKQFYFGESLTGRILRYSISGKSEGYIDGAASGMTSFILGMTVSADRHLWICGSLMIGDKKTNAVFQYDLENGALLSKYTDTSGRAGMFNDIAITKNGGIFITDTYTKSLFRIDTRNKIAVKYLQSDSLLNCNGITAFENDLFVSTSRGIVRVNTESNKISMVGFERFYIAGNDGLYYYKNSLIGVQNVLFPISISRFQLSADQNNINGGKLLIADHPAFGMPTTGAIVDNHFYFMANTNIEFYDDNKKEVEKMKPVRVVRISLR